MCFFPAYLTIPGSLFTVINNRKGSSESPLLNPFYGLNSSIGLPLTMIDIFYDSKQPFTQIIHVLHKDIFSSYNIKKITLVNHMYSHNQSLLCVLPSSNIVYSIIN